MMKLDIQLLLPHYRQLDLTSIRAAGYCSRIFPELPSGEELRSLAISLGENHGNITVYEFGKFEIISKNGESVEIISIFEEFNYLNCLLTFNYELFVWVPDHHEFFVVFGDNERISKLINSKVFDYTFEELLDESHISDTSRKELNAAYKNYNF